MYKTFGVFSCILSGILFSSSVMATNYYVRAYTSPNQYGVADGSDWDKAFNGLDNVQWDATGVSGVGPGDILYVCGMHPGPDDPLRYGINNQTQLNVGTSGESGNPITISFDCHQNPEQTIPDRGTIVRSAYQLEFDVTDLANLGWSELLDGQGHPTGVYEIAQGGATLTILEYEISTQAFRRLTRATDTPSGDPDQWDDETGVGLHTSGTYYYKPSAGVEHSIVYVTGQFGALGAVLIDGKKDIVVAGIDGFDETMTGSGRDINMLVGGIDIRNDAEQVQIKDLFIKFSEQGGIGLNDADATEPCSQIEISGNRIERSRFGIYHRSSNLPSSTACSQVNIRDNYVYHANYTNYWDFDDKHGIQLEAGNDNRIERNHIEKAGSHGIGVDGKSDAAMNRTTIAYNFIKDVGSPEDLFNETGIHLEGTVLNYVPDNQLDNVVHNNIFVGSNRAGIFISTAGKTSSGFSWAFYNNVIHSSLQDSVIMSDNPSSAPWEIGFTFKNNIVVDESRDPVLGHYLVQFGQISSDLSALDLNYNIYHQDASDAFLWTNGSPTDFAGWKEASGYSQEENSDATDPLFVNASGTFSTAADFQLSADSPAIDAGTNDIAVDSQSGAVNAERDFANNPIYGIPDRGAYEFQPPYRMGHDSIAGFPANNDNIAEKVRVYSNGRYRDVPSGGDNFAAELEVFPQVGGGTTEYTQDDLDQFDHWMDIHVTTWTANQKIWTVQRIAGTGTNNLKHFIRGPGIEAGKRYHICVDDVYWTSITAYGNATYSEATFAIGTPDGVTRKFEMVEASVAVSLGACNIQQGIFTSAGEEDGWLLEYTETSNVGGTSSWVGAGPRAIRFGDFGSVYTGDDRQYKAIVSFDTSILPAGAVVVDARLELTTGVFIGDDEPYATFGVARVDLSSGGFGGDPTLVPSDFEVAPTVTDSGQLIDDGTLATAVLNAAARTAIEGSSLIQLRIAFDIDDNDDLDDDYVGYYSGDNSDPGVHPRLVIDYALPD